MATDFTPETRRRIGRALSIAIILLTAITGLIVLRHTTENPRTDDAEVFANFIGIAPVVNGPIVKLPIVDNQLIKQGGLLFEIDRRPYAYALASAKSARDTLEGQIVDEKRTIASQQSGVGVAQAYSRSSEANLSRAAAAVDQAKAD